MEKEKLTLHSNGVIKEYEVTAQIFEEKEYLSVPVIMIIEGVHDGSHGPLLHLISELGKFPEAWNGIPVVVNHPQVDGGIVSANSPAILAKYKVGTIFNTHVDGNRLKAEAWINVDLAAKVDPDILERLHEGEIMEVSIGVFTEEEDVSGDWNGEAYTAIARNHRPDHLALLPYTVGACSVKDGCGIRLNKKGEKIMNLEELRLPLNSAGFTVLRIQDCEEAGFKERMEAFYGIFNAMDTKDSYHYVEELYSDHVVYTKNSEGGSKMYKQSYIMESGKIQLVGEPIEVHRKVEYVVVNNLRRTNFKKEDKMKTNECPTCIEKVNALIACERTKFTEDDRLWLSTLEVNALGKLVVDEVKPVEKKKEEIVVPVINAEQALKVLKESIQKPEDFLNLLPAEMKEQMEAGLKLHKAQRDNAIKAILANTESVWEEADLKAMNGETLMKVYASVQKEGTDYSLNGNNGRKVIETNTEEILAPTGVKISEPK